MNCTDCCMVLTKVGTRDDGFQDRLEQRVGICLQVVITRKTSLTAMSNCKIPEEQKVHRLSTTPHTSFCATSETSEQMRGPSTQDTCSLYELGLSPPPHAITDSTATPIISHEPSLSPYHTHLVLSKWTCFMKAALLVMSWDF